jgi:hypothetical protein
MHYRQPDHLGTEAGEVEGDQADRNGEQYWIDLAGGAVELSHQLLWPTVVSRRDWRHGHFWACLPLAT